MSRKFNRKSEQSHGHVGVSVAVDARSMKTCLTGLAVGGGMAVLAQLGMLPASIGLPAQSVVASADGQAGQPSSADTAQQVSASQATKPVDFSMYEVPSFMSAIYEGRFDETGYPPNYRTGYAIKMADYIRQACRGPFTTAQIKSWEDKIIRQELSKITPENGLKVLEQNMRGIMEVYKDPTVLAKANDGMPTPEEAPMKAQQDTGSFAQDTQCNGPVFDKFTSNLAQAAQMSGKEAVKEPR